MHGAATILTNRRHRDDFTRRMNGLVSAYSGLWFRSSDRLPMRLEQSTPAQRQERESEVELFLRSVPRGLNGYAGASQRIREKTRTRVRATVLRAFASEEDGSLEEFFSGCEGTTEAFLSSSRAFEPSLPDGDVHQALRNLWVFNSIQHTLGDRVSLTPPAFAYSLLYPYTDNALDDGCNGMDRGAFMHWVSCELRGDGLPPPDHRCVAIHRLLEMIFHEFPREEYPAVHRSLCAIQEAQRQAGVLQCATPAMDECFLIPLTVAKGGASVLVDGFLARGDLAPEDAEALFGFGVVLQLIDDLQDTAEDLRRGHSTAFTRASRDGALDRPTNRLFNFLQQYIDQIEAGRSNGSRSLSSVIARSCTFLIHEAIARHGVRYTGEYRRTMERFSPLRYAYLQGLHEEMERVSRGAASVQ